MKNKIKRIINRWLKEETAGLNLNKSNKMALIFSYYDIRELEELILNNLARKENKDDSKTS